jgi:hypothetical protein
MKKFLVFSVAIVFLAFGAYTSADDHEAILTAIHGIPGLPQPVDVFVNGVYQFSFDFNESVDNIPLPPDDYLIEVKLDGTTVLSGTASLESGKNYTAIAHLTLNDGGSGLKDSEDPGIKLSFFENNISDLKCWTYRLTLRHTADAPEVDIALRRGYWGCWFFAKAMGLSNNDSGDPGQFGPVDFIAGYFKAVFFPAGTDTEVFDSGRVKFERGNHYIVYAIGSIFDGSFTLFVQTIDLG